MALGSAPKNPKNAISPREGLKKDYAVFYFIKHYPFRDPDLAIDEPDYQEIDESGVIEMEREVFMDVNSFPKPPSNLSEPHKKYLNEAWDRFEKSRKDFSRNINEVKRKHTYFNSSKLEDPPDEPPNIISRVRTGLHRRVSDAVRRAQLNLTEVKDGILAGELRRTIEAVRSVTGIPNKMEDKKMMRTHFALKRIYLECALAYLYLYKGCPEIDGKEKTDAQEMFDKVECIQLAHGCYSIVQSAADRLDGRGDQSARRKSGKLVMSHVYDVCIHEMNRYQKELEETPDPKARRRIYTEMKLAIARALLHDFLEDFGEHFNAKTLRQKCIQIFNFEFHNIFTVKRGSLKEEGYTGIPDNLIFIDRFWAKLLPELKALIKPKDSIPEYISENISNLPQDSKVRTLKTKNADRKHGLEKLDTLPFVVKQAYKVIDSLAIIELNIELHTPKNHLLEDAAMLIDTAIEQADILFESHAEFLENQTYIKPQKKDQRDMKVRLLEAIDDLQIKRVKVQALMAA